MMIIRLICEDYSLCWMFLKKNRLTAISKASVKAGMMYWLKVHV